MTDAFQPKSDFLRVMQERGYIHQCSDLQGLDDKARSGSLVGYNGFDCTAPSLHVGSLVPIMMLHWLQETGGEPVALMGSGTTMVGDPSSATEAAAATARMTFEEGSLAETLPTVDVPGAEFEAGLGVLTAFLRSGLVASTGEGRRQIRGGGLRVNDAPVEDERALITRDALRASGVVKLSLGRKKHVLLRAA